MLLPGTLCDARLFAPMLSNWPKNSVLQVADLHRLHDPQAWWQEQLSQLPETFDVLGFSLGGILAMQLLALAPERVRRLVLVASNPQAGTAMHAQRVQAQRAQWLQSGSHALALQLLEQTTAPPALSAPMIEIVEEMIEATPLQAFDAQGHINAHRADGCAALAQWSGPLMLISGSSDPWCGADKQELMRTARPDALWHVLPGGHYLPLEQPLTLARLSDEFLN